MTRTLVGYAITDSNGVATYNYTGQGVGEMEITAENGGEVYFADNNDPNNWQSTSTSLGTVTSTSNGLKFTGLTSTLGTIYPVLPNATRVIDYNFVNGEDFTLEFELISNNGSNNRIQFYNGSSTSGTDYYSRYMHGISTGKVKLVYKNNTITEYQNGTLIETTNFNPNANFRVVFQTLSGDFTIKNFFIYREDENPLISTPFSLVDCTAYDTGVTGTANDTIWNNTTNMTRGNEYTTITGTNVILKYAPISGDVCIELDLMSDMSGTDIISSIRNNDTSLRNMTLTQLGMTSNNWKTVKIMINDNLLSVEGTEISNVDVTGFNRFYIRSGANKHSCFKNLKIYPI